MRSRVSRVAAAVIFVLAVTGVALWFHAGGATPAYADFLKPILEAKTARYKMTTEMTGARRRNDDVRGHDARPVCGHAEEIGNRACGTCPKQRCCKSGTDTKESDSLWSRNTSGPRSSSIPAGPRTTPPRTRIPWACGVRCFSMPRTTPDVNREPLGEKEIDGRRVIGFRITLQPGR